MERVHRWIEARLDQPISVTDLARVSHMSPRALLRAFHARFGTAPARYLRARRLDEAMLLLRSKRSDVSEVATRVGYQNLSAFSHAFGERFGVPPSHLLREQRPATTGRVSAGSWKRGTRKR